MNTPTIKLHQQYRYNLVQLLYSTDMTEDELNDFMAETADTWLRRFFNGRIDHDAIMNSHAFRKWWRMQWFDRDDRYFLAKLYDEPKEERFALYRQFHQCVFAMMQPLTQYMYQDFLDMLPNFQRVPVTH